MNISRSVRRVRGARRDQGLSSVREWVDVDVDEFEAHGRVYPAVGSKKSKVGIVFAGGGSLGASQVGMLGTLIERGVVPDLVVGTSIGALNAAAFAQDPSVHGIRQMAEVWRNAAATNPVFGYSKAGEIMRFTLKRESVYPTKALLALLDELLKFDRIEDAPLRYGVVTSSLTGNPERCWWEGRARELLLASAAIPGMFPPVAYDGLTLIDGGVTNNVPINHAVEAGCNKIYVLLSKPVLQTAVAQGPRPIDSLMGAFSLARQARLYSDLEAIGDGVELVIIPSTGKLVPYHTDLSSTAELIEQGRAVAELFMERADYALAAFEASGGHPLKLRDVTQAISGRMAAMGHRNEVELLDV
jgi:NTE family protein